ncbi:hypothetical protein HGRIS_006106 [Hohenbuehelia grisea]|uniref:Alpha-1,3-glucosyltransferase n=1 Tax=Hohenbuehelia grisea TaxID=104357 RepID=A0ABR3K0Z6_9AGAR
MNASHYDVFRSGSWFEPSWFALDKSRGIETEGSKVFMRASVVVIDAMVYVPAIYLFVTTWQASRSKRTQNLGLLTLLFQPALLLIDFGHFQYNSVMLGLTLFAVCAFATGRDLLGAFCFVLSLGFKQMALYYAPAVGSYLLGKCLFLGPNHGSRLFIRLAVVTTLSFLLLFIPFIPPFAPLSAITHPLTRIFPFNRGLFEDKVANFWCASNVVFKWKQWASRDALVKLSASLTALGFLPSVGTLLQVGAKLRLKGEPAAGQADAHTPILPLLPYALFTSSMSFFLFSFQVHEKTILLPLMPLTLLLCGAPLNSAMFGWATLVNNVAVFSMWPLLKRDGLGLPYVATLVLWNRLIGYNPIRLPSKSFIQLISFAVYTAAVTLHIAEWLITPPQRYPDIFPVLNVLICTPVFALAWLWSIKSGVQVGWALSGLGASASASVGALRSPLENGGEPVKPRDRKVSAMSASAAATGREGGSLEGSAGNRAMSLGYAAGRRRAPLSRPRTTESGAP